MYDLDRFIGEVVTIKMTGGLEIIAQLASVDDDTTTVTVFRPRVVVVADNEIAVVPYTFTSDEDMVVMSTQGMLSVAKSDSQSATEYTQATTLEEDSKS